MRGAVAPGCSLPGLTDRVSGGVSNSHPRQSRSRAAFEAVSVGGENERAGPCNPASSDRANICSPNRLPTFEIRSHRVAEFTRSLCNLATIRTVCGCAHSSEVRKADTARQDRRSPYRSSSLFATHASNASQERQSRDGLHSQKGELKEVRLEQGIDREWRGYGDCIHGRGEMG